MSGGRFFNKIQDKKVNDDELGEVLDRGREGAGCSFLGIFVPKPSFEYRRATCRKFKQLPPI